MILGQLITALSKSGRHIQFAYRKNPLDGPNGPVRYCCYVSVQNPLRISTASGSNSNRRNCIQDYIGWGDDPTDAIKDAAAQFLTEARETA